MVGVDYGHYFAGVAGFDDCGGEANAGGGVAHCWFDEEVCRGDLGAKFADELVMVLVDRNVNVFRFEEVEARDGFFQHCFGGNEGLELFWFFVGGEWPEARAAAASEDYSFQIRVIICEKFTIFI